MISHESFEMKETIFQERQHCLQDMCLKRRVMDKKPILWRNKQKYFQSTFLPLQIDSKYILGGFGGLNKKRGVEFPEQFANLCGGGGKVYVSKFLSICQPSNRV